MFLVDADADDVAAAAAALPIATTYTRRPQLFPIKRYTITNHRTSKQTHKPGGVVAILWNNHRKIKSLLGRRRVKRIDR